MAGRWAAAARRRGGAGRHHSIAARDPPVVREQLQGRSPAGVEMAALLWRGLRPAGAVVCMARLSTARSVHSLRPLVVASRVSTRRTALTTDRYRLH